MCDKPIPYRFESAKPRMHYECRGAYNSLHGLRTGEHLPCSHCGREVYRAAWELAEHKNAFCSPECDAAYRRTHVSDALKQANAKRRTCLDIRCTECGTVKSYPPSALPVSVDQETLTWTCHYCRPRESAMITITCGECGHNVRRQIKRFDPAKTYYCSKNCRWAAQRKAADGTTILTLTCPICVEEAQAGLRAADQVTFQVPKSRLEWHPLRYGTPCCSKKHSAWFIKNERAHRIECPHCHCMFRPRLGQKYCKRSCWKDRGPALAPIANTRLAKAEEDLRRAAAKKAHWWSWSELQRATITEERDKGLPMKTIKKLVTSGVVAVMFAGQ